MKNCDIAVIGAGPYGLSVAAHLRARSLNTLIFGQPMSFWATQMPAGMLLRSPWEASSLSDPSGKLTLKHYLEKDGKKCVSPVPREDFVNYGLWFQRELVPDVDTRNVDCVVRKNGGFHLTLADGEQIKASRVVVATGQAPFRRRPRQFDGLPSALASHSSEHSDFAPFKHRRVAVIGAGQSALESAALLHEAGAEVELLVRNPEVHWLENHLGQIGPVTRLLWVKAGVNRVAAHPNYFRYLPRYFHERYSALRPAGSDWLRPRIEGKVPTTTGRVVASAKPRKDQLELTLDDGSQRVVDHVLLATGYSIDISRYEFLAAPLLASIATVHGFPYLNGGFECSVPGLHFAGAPASWSFGPLMRFVAGAECAARAIARRAMRGPAAAADMARVLRPSLERNRAMAVFPTDHLPEGSH